MRFLMNMSVVAAALASSGCLTLYGGDVLAPVAGRDVTELLDRLGAEGFVVDDAGTSVRQLAEQYDAEADDILVSLFR